MRFGQLREIVIGMDAAQQRQLVPILTQVDILQNVRTHAQVIICRGEAKDFLSRQKSVIGKRLSTYLDVTLASLRLKVFYDGFQDVMALRLLESKIGREKVLEFIDKDLFKPLTFMEYPHETDWLIDMREAINMKIKEN